MLYTRVDGRLHPRDIPRWQVRQFHGQELWNITQRLNELMQQKGVNEDKKIFSAPYLVGQQQINWEDDPALQTIILRYPHSQGTQSNILGRILFQVLFDSPNNYEYSKVPGARYAQYRKL